VDHDTLAERKTFTAHSVPVYALEVYGAKNWLISGGSIIKVKHCPLIAVFIM
jgi:hypothetical protein